MGNLGATGVGQVLDEVSGSVLISAWALAAVSVFLLSWASLSLLLWPLV